MGAYFQENHETMRRLFADQGGRKFVASDGPEVKELSPRQRRACELLAATSYQQFFGKPADEKHVKFAAEIIAATASLCFGVEPSKTASATTSLSEDQLTEKLRLC